MAELAEVVYQRELNYSKRLARNFARDPYWPSREGVDQPPRPFKLHSGNRG